MWSKWGFEPPTISNFLEKFVVVISLLLGLSKFISIFQDAFGIFVYVLSLSCAQFLRSVSFCGKH